MLLPVVTLSSPCIIIIILLCHLLLLTPCRANIISLDGTEVLMNSIDSLNACKSNDECGISYSRNYIDDVYYSGLRKRTSKATTLECKQRIEYEYMKYIRATALEEGFPFELVWFASQCPNLPEKPPNPIQQDGVLTLGTPIQSTAPSTSYPSPRNNSVDPSVLSIVYIVLVHEHPEFVVRLIDALDEPMHSFVIHVDARADTVAGFLSSSLKHRTNIHFLNTDRERISWGGFSIVNATLKCMRYAWDQHLHFDYMVDISGTHYPIKSNYYIRKTLAASPNKIHLDSIPFKHLPHMFHQYVECDGAMHRIGRLPLAKGINLYVGSQWWAFPTYFVHWLLTSQLAKDYIHYAQYVPVADENYFNTLFYNSPYCDQKTERNLTFIIFDRDKAILKLNNAQQSITGTNKSVRDDSKCIFPDPTVCGVSPDVLTIASKGLVEQSRSLFSRKFDPSMTDSVSLVDYIDSRRGTNSKRYSREVFNWDRNRDVANDLITMIQVSSHAKDHMSRDPDDMDINRCITFPVAATGDKSFIRLERCDPKNEQQWIELDRCNPDYDVTIEDGKCPVFKRKQSSANNNRSSSSFSSPYCSLLRSSTLTGDLCMDILGGMRQSGTPLILYQCNGGWNQLYRVTDNCSILSEFPPKKGESKTESYCIDKSYTNNNLYTISCNDNSTSTLTFQFMTSTGEAFKKFAT